jgi:hypothetical protein
MNSAREGDYSGSAAAVNRRSLVLARGTAGRPRHLLSGSLRWRATVSDFARLRLIWEPRLLSISRIMIGLLFLEHGTAKVLDFPHH